MPHFSQIILIKDYLVVLAQKNKICTQKKERKEEILLKYNRVQRGEDVINYLFELLRTIG